jgi:hypothetical protein
MVMSKPTMKVSKPLPKAPDLKARISWATPPITSRIPTMIVLDEPATGGARNAIVPAIIRMKPLVTAMRRFP